MSITREDHDTVGLIEGNDEEEYAGGNGTGQDGKGYLSQIERTAMEPRDEVCIESISHLILLPKSSLLISNILEGLVHW